MLQDNYNPVVFKPGGAPPRVAKGYDRRSAGLLYALNTVFIVKFLTLAWTHLQQDYRLRENICNTRLARTSH